MLELGTAIKIDISEEEGIIKGRCEYTEFPDQYWVKYKSAQGSAKESWFVRADITPIK